MSNDKHQVKLTKSEIEAALISVAHTVINETSGYNGLTENTVDRFNYLSKRLLAIQTGKPNIETEQVDTNNNAPKAEGWN